MQATALALVAAHGLRAAVPAPSAASQPPDAPACYRADRALGTSAGSAVGRGVPGLVGRQIGEDSASLWRLTTFRVLPGGRVDRPAASKPDSWARGSRWGRSGDTLHVTLSTGTSGWALTLTTKPPGADGTHVGVARYLTDVVVADTAAWRPPRVPVRVWREPCPPPA